MAWKEARGRARDAEKTMVHQLSSQIPALPAGLARKYMEIPGVSFPVVSFPELQRQEH